jgi:hypothetical protein
MVPATVQQAIVASLTFKLRSDTLGTDPPRLPYAFVHAAYGVSPRCEGNRMIILVP